MPDKENRKEKYGEWTVLKILSPDGKDRMDAVLNVELDNWQDTDEIARIFREEYNKLRKNDYSDSWKKPWRGIVVNALDATCERLKCAWKYTRYLRTIDLKQSEI